MLEEIKGSAALARAIAQVRPQVVCAGPAAATPIIESLGEIAREGGLEICHFLAAESESAALFAAVGAAKAGARVYAAAAGCGLPRAAEALVSASALALPIVMTLGDGAGPSDHSDAMALRETGWIQLFAETIQDAVDLHLQAFRLAEELCAPTMVCVDGARLAGAERVEVPAAADLDAFAPPEAAARRCVEALSDGATIGPDAEAEVRYLEYFKRRTALALIEEIAEAFARRFGRGGEGLLRPYRTEGAERIVVALGSLNGAIREAIDDLRAEGQRIGLVALVAFRPFPVEALRAALAQTHEVIVIDKALDVGVGGPLARDVAFALAGLPQAPALRSAIVGLGGRAVPKASLLRLLRQAASEAWDGPYFLDLNERIVAREIHCGGHVAPGGPAEAILRRLERERQAEIAAAPTTR